MTEKLVRKPSVLLHCCLFTIYMLPCMILFGTGLFLCLTIIGIAPGMALMALAGVPIAAESNRYIKRRVAWKMQQAPIEEYKQGKHSKRGKHQRPNVKMDPYLDYEYDPVLDEMVQIKKPWVE